MPRATAAFAVFAMTMGDHQRFALGLIANRAAQTAAPVDLWWRFVHLISFSILTASPIDGRRTPPVTPKPACAIACYYLERTARYRGV